MVRGFSVKKRKLFRVLTLYVSLPLALSILLSFSLLLSVPLSIPLFPSYSFSLLPSLSQLDPRGPPWQLKESSAPITMTTSPRAAAAPPLPVPGLLLLLLLLLPIVLTQNPLLPSPPTPAPLAPLSPQVRPECSRREHPVVSVQGERSPVCSTANAVRFTGDRKSVV